MTTLTTEEPGTAQAPAAEKPKPARKARVAPKRAHVAPKKAKTATKAKVSQESAHGHKEGLGCP